MKRSDSISALAKALTVVQDEMPKLEKDKKGVHGAMYADLAQVISKSTPVLKKHKLAIAQFPSGSSTDAYLTTMLIHETGEYIEANTKLIVTKQDMQGYGGAITYARRYAWVSILGMVDGEDDDGDSTRLITIEQKRLLFGLARKYLKVANETGFETAVHTLTGKTSDKILAVDFDTVADQIKTGEVTNE